MGNLLSPLASLCLGAVKGWINVARRNRGGIIDDEGTAWTRLPADQLRDQLEDEYQVEVSTRSVQRALKELSDRNHLRREQRWKHRYNRDYWYALPTYEEELNRHRPRTISGNYQSVQKGRKIHSETTGAAVQVLSTPTTNTHFSKQPASKPNLRSSKREMPRSTTSETARTRKETHMRGVLERCEEMANPRPPLPQSGGHERPELEPETSGTTGSASIKGSPRLEIGSGPQGYESRGQSTGRGPAWHAGGQVSPTPTGPMQSPNNGQPAGRDHQGRPMREVWVGGVPHLVID